MTPDQLNDLSAKELRALAASHEIRGRSKMRKAELIAAISQIIDPKLVSQAPTALSNQIVQNIADHPSSTTSSMPVEQAQESYSPNGNPGLPIPDHYGQDVLVLMPQDPHHIYTYWELAGHALHQARQQLGEMGSPVLVIYGPHGSEQRDIDLGGGNYYLTVQEQSSYHAELALRGSNGRLVRVCASNTVVTAAASPSENDDEEWMVVDDTFQELLQRAGLPSEGLSSAELLRKQHIHQWSLNQTPSFSSGKLQSSGSLSSWNLTKPNT